MKDKMVFSFFSECSSSAHLGQLEMAKRGWGWEFGAAQGHNKQLVVGWLS